MQISIKTLEGQDTIVELEEVGTVTADEDVIYFEGVPCLLSSAKPAPPLQTREQIICDILQLAFLVQEHTDYCVFIRYSGHVNSLDVEICESKKNYAVKLLESEFYTNGVLLQKAGDPHPFLNAKKEILQRILNERSIPYELCDVERFEVEDYSF